jgi:aspartate-semialdehyde dehydrogenase
MNIHVAQPFRPDTLAHLADRRLLRELAYVDGKWTAGRGGASFPVTDPATGETVANVARLDADAATEAVAAAARSLPRWRAEVPQERANKLRRWYDLIVAARTDLAILMVREQGKPLAEALGEIDYAASFVEWFAEEAKRLNVESVSSHFTGVEMSVQREPVGVVAVVTPWNFPAAMLTRKVAAALAAGCTVVAHPASETPLSALALAELADRAGIPPGVFNLVTGPAAEIVGAFTADTRVRAISFTGSTEIGRLIAANAAVTVKRLILELGGHAPFIVFDDADLDKAVDLAVQAKFATSGQDCLAANRIYVQRGIYDRFVEAFTRHVAALKVGPGFDDGVEIGPLMHARAVTRAEDHVADAVAHGARLVTGGARHSAGRLFYRPTVLADVPDEARIMREETFGPVAAVTPFDSEEEIVARANATEYGLVAYLVTEDYRRIARVSRALAYGMVAVNRVKITGAPIPFGGIKQSGIGREGSRQGIEAYTEIKYVCLDVA